MKVRHHRYLCTIISRIAYSTMHGKSLSMTPALYCVLGSIVTLGVRQIIHMCQNGGKVNSKGREPDILGVSTQQKQFPVKKIRNLLFSLYGNLGILSSHLMDLELEEETHTPRIPPKTQPILKSHIMKNVYEDIISLAKEVRINLIIACENKMKLNEQKYPAPQAKVRDDIVVPFCCFFVALYIAY